VVTGDGKVTHRGDGTKPAWIKAGDASDAFLKKTHMQKKLNLAVTRHF